MSRWESWLLHVLTFVVGASGLVYFWMKYLLPTGDPFSVINHPLQPLTLDIHILAAPVYMFVLGVIFQSHVGKKLRSKTIANRRSGFVILFAFPLMVVSGYLLQLAANPAFQKVVLVTHLASSTVFLATYVGHQVFSLLLLRSAARESVPEA